MGPEVCLASNTHAMAMCDDVTGALPIHKLVRAHNYTIEGMGVIRVWFWPLGHAHTTVSPCVWFCENHGKLGHFFFTPEEAFFPPLLVVSGVSTSKGHLLSSVEALGPAKN